jgi:hypothetical protein
MLNWLSSGKKTAAEQRVEQLSAYIDGELAPRERAAVERALAADPALRTELQELRQVVGMMKEVPQVPLRRSFTLDPAVYGRAQRSVLRLYPVLRTATVLATVALIFLFAGDLFVGLRGGAGMPAEVVQEPQAAVMREAIEETVVESEVEATLLAEAPEAKLSADAVEEEAAPEEPQAESMERVTRTEAAPVAGTEAATSGPEAEQMEGEEPTEGPMAMAVPATATAAETTEAEPQSPVPPAPEATVEAFGLGASDEATAAPEGEMALRAGEAMEEGPNWLLIAEIGLGGLALTLLLVTLLARRYGW